MIFKLVPNVLRLPEGGDLNHKTMIEALHLIKAIKLIRSTEPPLFYSPCYTLFVLIFCAVGNHLIIIFYEV